MKICTGCKVEKSESEFFKHPGTKDGLGSRCKACNAEAGKRRYWADRKSHLEKCRIRWEKRKHTAAYKAQRAAYQRKHRERFPEIRNAWKAIENALRKGEITKGVCEKCGTSEKVQAHHDDYLKPLEVRWFCFLHHREHHGTFVRVA